MSARRASVANSRADWAGFASLPCTAAKCFALSSNMRDAISSASSLARARVSPLPMTNTIPGFAVALAAFGLINRDGFLVVIGCVLGLTALVPYLVPLQPQLLCTGQVAG